MGPRGLAGPTGPQGPIGPPAPKTTAICSNAYYVGWFPTDADCSCSVKLISKAKSPYGCKANSDSGQCTATGIENALNQTGAAACCTCSTN